jgi:hypothetical protein
MLELIRPVLRGIPFKTGRGHGGNLAGAILKAIPLAARLAVCQNQGTHNNAPATRAVRLSATSAAFLQQLESAVELKPAAR